MKNDVEAFQKKATTTILTAAKVELQLLKNKVWKLFCHGLKQNCVIVVMKLTPSVDHEFYGKLALVDAFLTKKRLIQYSGF